MSEIRLVNRESSHPFGDVLVGDMVRSPSWANERFPGFGLVLEVNPMVGLVKVLVADVERAFLSRSTTIPGAFTHISIDLQQGDP